MDDNHAPHTPPPPPPAAPPLVPTGVADAGNPGFQVEEWAEAPITAHHPDPDHAGHAVPPTGVVLVLADESRVTPAMEFRGWRADGVAVWDALVPLAVLDRGVARMTVEQFPAKTAIGVRELDDSDDSGSGENGATDG